MLTHKKLPFVVSILSLAALALAACQPAPVAAQVPTSAPQVVVVPTAQPPAQPAASEAVLNVATDAKLGKILVDGKGMTLYMYTKDSPDQSNCSGGCLKAWPAFLTQGNPKLGDGIDASLVSNVALADGSKIVVYNHMPLYYFAKDTKPGDTLGQDVGKVWYVVSPDGKIIGKDAAVQPAAASEVVLNVATDAKLGKILVDGKGMTLYMYTKDGPDQSNCSGGCLKAWPAFLTQGNPKLGEGIDASLVSNVALADGSKIVVYNHMPLYYYAKDTKAGDTLGQDVGKVWYVVSPDGKIIGKDAPAAQAAPASGGAVVKVADSSLGKILVDDKGMTLYLFKKDTPGVSNCSAGCLKVWPPFLSQGSPVAGTGVMGKLGTVALADGSMIVTYNGMPLYYYAADQKPGDTTGQGVGGVWFVVNP